MYVYALVKAMDKTNFENIVVIPNYGQERSEEYYYDNTRVIKYSEPSVVDRDLQMGKRKPDGLGSFIEVLKREAADIVHFHELAGSNGTTLHHVKAAKDVGCKIVMTFHLGNYSCKTGTLMYKNQEECDGIISIKKCTLCCYHFNGLSEARSSLLYPLAGLFYKLGVNASEWNSRAGTAFGYPFIIETLRKDLRVLTAYCDKLVLISKWYREVLLKNGIPENKIAFIKQGVYNLVDLPVNNIPANRPIKIIFIGRISHFKGVKMLITAIKKLDAQKVQLDIYGDTGEEAYMNECKIMSAGAANILWKGRLPQHEVLTCMQQYDLLCLPSTFSEMSPLVIQEAFAAKIPVLASGAKGNAEQIVNSVNGWLFKFNDEDDLLSQLGRLVDNPSLIDRAKENIPGVSSFRETATQYQDIYRSLSDKVPLDYKNQPCPERQE